MIWKMYLLSNMAIWDIYVKYRGVPTSTWRIDYMIFLQRVADELAIDKGHKKNKDTKYKNKRAP